MHTRDPVDVNIFGAVRIAAPVDVFIRQLRAIENYERRLGVLQVGKFRNPPQPADLAGLTLERDDLLDLASCRVGDCEIQLAGTDIERFRALNWRAVDVSAAANGAFRTMVFDWLQKYRTGGHRALPTYADQAHPISIPQEVKLLSAPGDVPVPMPEIGQYLSGFPAFTLADADDFYYWNKGEFGMKPTIRLNHVTVYPVRQPSGPEALRYVVITSQVYSSHYFSATLELRTIVDDAARPGQGFYLLYTTKSRVTGLTGFMGTLIRGLVRSRARSGMERYLTNTKTSVEGRW